MIEYSIIINFIFERFLILKFYVLKSLLSKLIIDIIVSYINPKD
jgi:hypothetical protein